MVLTQASKMSRTDEVHRITENVYKSIMEQFNPCLRNFVAMGKTYEKALSSVTFAAKGYFDALVRMGELASESHGSKDLGDVLFQMAEVHRQIQMQLEDMLKSFHNELLTELEKKVELDVRYLNAALKKYQMEHKSKGESLEKCQAELKKLRRKSQGSKNPSKYGDKEMQYVETISSKQNELDNYISESYKNALSEERRRYCFLVDRQCAVAKTSSTYHTKGRDLLTHKIPLWQQACADPNKLPERAMLLAQQMGSGAVGTLGHHTSKSNLTISDPIPGAKPLPVPPELAALMGSQQTRMMGAECVPIMNGSGAHGGEDYQRWMETRAAHEKPSAQSHRHGVETFSNTLPVRKGAPAKPKNTLAETQTLPRSSSMAAGLERNGRTRVQALFSHAAGDNSTLLSFMEGDIITLLVPEARDGWHYGENEKNRMRGWFPFSYTRVIPEPDSNKLHVSLQHNRSSSTGNLLEREMALPTPDYGMPARFLAQQQSTPHSRQRPYSMAVPGFSQQGLEEYESRFQTRVTDPLQFTTFALTSRQRQSNFISKQKPKLIATEDHGSRLHC
ncbi:brain-specific angiogenesis inhibitor 1-associated protein 2 isoform X3 [Pimephales promelas]|uniref:brain-specific angiogenesis inhibitor 1-associated protein 2 isoform X3 n=1 Tax=Pimephales promelas TaxID=90988 RepID=UPI00195562A8|nr:brain-specific angiogenesis inhibitor 1-associated protein 2 isoform X3 [Pimephales promelas]